MKYKRIAPEIFLLCLLYGISLLRIAFQDDSFLFFEVKCEAFRIISVCVPQYRMVISL